MFVGWRDLRWARGRFALVVVTVTLITVLVGLLTGLTAGLGRASSSAIADLDASQVVLSSDSWSTSQVPSGTVPDSQALGVAQVRAQSASSSTATPVALFGVEPNSIAGPVASAVKPGGAILSQDAADELGDGNGPPSEILIGTTTVPVIGVQGTDSYGHQPVVWVDLAQWLSLTHSTQPTAAISDTTVDQTNLPAGWTVTSPQGAVAAIPGYSSEHGSLVMIQVFLVAISALVIGAFFTVWTMQRTRDVAVLKALGATNRVVLTDALGQAGVVLAVGVLGGGAIASGVGLLAQQVVPFHLPLTQLAGPLGLLAVLGLIGAALAVRSVVRVNPLLALNGR